MPNYLTPEELAEQLKVEVGDVVSLIEQGKLRALRIGSKLRVREEDVEKLQATCAAVPSATSPISSDDNMVLSDGTRWCLTRTGKAKFRVAGSIASGASIWPGKMPYPIRFPKEFMDTMLKHFSNTEVPVGGKFDDPGRGTLGKYIQRKLKIKMNPAVYLAALLIDEGYAESGRRGRIRFLSKNPKSN